MQAELRSLRDRTDALVARLEADLENLDDRNQFVFSNAIVLKSGGLIEQTVILTLEAYCKNKSKPDIAAFVRKKISWMNSFDCEKISNLLNEFDTEWWPTVQDQAGPQCMSSIDSIKSIRDKVAHGVYNGTGFTTVKQYYLEVRRLPEVFANVIK